MKTKRAAGIEPASSAWKAEVLPLNYARTGTPEPQLRGLGLIKCHPIIMAVRVNPSSLEREFLHAGNQPPAPDDRLRPG